jgi:hypothetical protein
MFRGLQDRPQHGGTTKEDNMFRVSLRVPLGLNRQVEVRFGSGTGLLPGTATTPSDRIRRTGLFTNPSHISPYDLWQEIPLVTFNFLGWLGDLLDQWGTVLAAATTTDLLPARWPGAWRPIGFGTAVPSLGPAVDGHPTGTPGCMASNQGRRSG